MAQLYALSPGQGMKAIPLSALQPGFFSASGDGTALINVMDAYRKVGWVYRAVNIIAEALSGLPYDFHDLNSDAVVEAKDAARRLRFTFDYEEVMNSAAADLTLFGAAYWILDSNQAGVVKEIRRLHPSTMEPQYDDVLGLVNFKRQVNGTQYLLDPDDVVWVWQPNREAELGPGVPPAYAALYAAGVLHQIDLYGQGFFKNGATNPTLVYLEDNSALLGDDEVKAFQGWLDRVAAGTSRAFKNIFVRHKLGQVTLGSAPKDLEMPGLTEKKREDIATALGVPHSLLFSNAANYATAEQDDLHFYDKTIKPLAQRIVNRLSARVFERYGLTLQVHPERLEIYQKLEGEKTQALATARDRKVISVNEMRTEIGFSALDEDVYDDVEYTPSGAAGGASQPFGGPQSRQLENLPDEDDQPDDEALLEEARERLTKALRASGRRIPERITQERPTMKAHPADCDCEACNPDEERPAVAELKQWQRFTLKRVRGGKSGRPFETEHLRASQKATIEAALDGVTDENTIRLIFNDAMRWAEYP